MPSLTFVLPHWMYWSGLLLFPLAALYIVHVQKGKARPRLSVPIAYLLLGTAGFAGLHRFYVRSLLGLLFIPMFVGILLVNVEHRAARNLVSSASNDVMVATFDRDQAKEKAPEKLPAAQQALVEANAKQAAAEGEEGKWNLIARTLAIIIVIMLAIDAVLLPRLVARARAKLPPGESAGAEAPDYTEAVPKADADPARAVHSRITDAIDRLNGFVGQFVALWSVIAVFVYYYEVLARYVFNSPTNWAHESMFLMFGMQYLLAGGFALREDSHVRVDVLYQYLPWRMKALTDVITSVFFFIFVGAMVWTGWIFAHDAVRVWEVSFTEWAIQYWPVKIAIPLGAALLLLQGIAKLIKDVLLLTGPEMKHGA